MTIGQVIQIIRKEKGLTQKQLAEKCGMATGTIQQYELNKREPRQKQLQIIANALNVSIHELVGHDGCILVEETPAREYNRIMDKQKSGDGFTPYDIRFVSDFIKNNTYIREWFVINGLKSHEENMRNIQSSYEQLNEEGRKEAAKRIGELAEIERYTKPDGWFQGKCSEKELHEAVEKLILPPQVGENEKDS